MVTSPRKWQRIQVFCDFGQVFAEGVTRGIFCDFGQVFAKGVTQEGFFAIEKSFFSQKLSKILNFQRVGC